MSYIGEEAVYTITSLEMWFRKEWITPIIYGRNYARPPLYNWFIIPLASRFGWDNVLIVSRLITALATISTAFVLMWFTQNIFKKNPEYDHEDKQAEVQFHFQNFALFSALIYLSGDLLLSKGWIAYSDPLFSFFIFSSIACLWVSLEDKFYNNKYKNNYDYFFNFSHKYLSFILLFFSALLISAAFLTKAFTAYVFYYISFIILLLKHPNGYFLITLRSLIIQFLILIFPILWSFKISQGAHGPEMIEDILIKIKPHNILELHKVFEYIQKIFLYPFDTAFRFLPSSFLLIYFLFKNRTFGAEKKGINHLLNTKNTISTRGATGTIDTLNIIFWISLLNYLPYWMAPVSHARYLLPIFPFISLLIAYFLWMQGEEKIKITLYFLTGFLIFKYILGLYGYQLIEEKFHGNYKIAAEEILEIVKKKPYYEIYANDDSGKALSVIAHLNVLRLPNPPLTWNLQQKMEKKEGNERYERYVLSGNPLPNSIILKEYKFGRNKLYLLELPP